MLRLLLEVGARKDVVPRTEELSDLKPLRRVTNRHVSRSRREDLCVAASPPERPAEACRLDVGASAANATAATPPVAIGELLRHAGEAASPSAKPRSQR